jgi:hypothetical protein
MTIRAILVIASSLTACPGPISPAPPGADRCASDVDCPETMHCGYEGVDRPFICLDGAPDDPLMARPTDAGR